MRRVAMADDSREYLHAHVEPHGEVTKRVRVSVAPPEVATYESIAVHQCVYCFAPDVVVAFVFIQPRGLRVGVPGRVGLCAECLSLLRDRDFDGVLVRTRDTEFAEFDDADVRELIKATVPAIPARTGIESSPCARQ
jgi:hypothetical protein